MVLCLTTPSFCTSSQVFPFKPVFRIYLKETDISEAMLRSVLTYVTRTFSRIRGKDITWRVMGQKPRSLSLHTRQKVSAVSNSKTSPKKQKKSKESEVDEHRIIIEDEDSEDSDVDENDIDNNDI